jgi:hypothetical protein
MNSPRSSSRIRSGVSGQQGDTAKEVEHVRNLCGKPAAATADRAVPGRHAGTRTGSISVSAGRRRTGIISGSSTGITDQPYDQARTATDRHADAATGSPVAGLGQDAGEGPRGGSGRAGGRARVAAAPAILRRLPRRQGSTKASMPTRSSAKPWPNPRHLVGRRRRPRRRWNRPSRPRPSCRPRRVNRTSRWFKKSRRNLKFSVI